jgi:hypothetical protein
MAKLLQKAFDEAGMPWPEIRKRYLHEWLLLEATEAHSSGGRRILERLIVLEVCLDGLSAMRRYGELQSQDPHRELYVLHTDRATVEIEEAHWPGIRAAS